MAAALQGGLASRDDTMWGGRGGRRRAAGSPRGRGSHEGAGGTGGCGARGWACFKGGGTPIRLRSGQVPPPLRIPLLVQRGRDGSRGALRQGQDRLRPRPTVWPAGPSRAEPGRAGIRLRRDTRPTERRTAGGDGYPRPTATAERRTAGGHASAYPPYRTARGGGRGNARPTERRRPAGMGMSALQLTAWQEASG